MIGTRLRLSAARIGITALSLALLLAACGDDSPSSDQSGGPAVVKAASLAPGDPVPPANVDPVLTVNGAGRTNTSSALSLDLDALEQLGVVEATVYEPFEKADTVFRGVELSRILDFAEVPETADLHFVALDDYSIDLTGAEARTDGVIVATQVNGEAIPIEEGGPVRVVFLDSSELAGRERLWIWSLAQIDVTS